MLLMVTCVEKLEEWSFRKMGDEVTKPKIINHGWGSYKIKSKFNLLKESIFNLLKDTLIEGHLTCSNYIGFQIIEGINLIMSCECLLLFFFKNILINQLLWDLLHVTIYFFSLPCHISCFNSWRKIFSF